MFQLKVDSRERALILLFREKSVEVIVETLDIGDIQIINIEDSSIQLIFERKTISDLHSSIRDGRYHEQKSRLVSNVDRNRICYLLEGDIRTASRVDVNSVYGAVINTLFRDQILVYRSRDMNDTYEFLHGIITRMNKNEATSREWLSFLNGIQKDKCVDVDPAVYKHANKSKNVTKEVIYVNMLSDIPGCSTKIACVIRENYPTMKILMDELQKNKNVLQNLKIGARKLGPALSKKIYLQLYGEETIEEDSE